MVAIQNFKQLQNDRHKICNAKKPHQNLPQNLNVTLLFDEMV